MTVNYSVIVSCSAHFPPGSRNSGSKTDRVIADSRYSESRYSEARSYIYQEKLYFLAKSNQQAIIDVSLFMLAMSMSKNCSYLVRVSDDLDENVKAAAVLTAVFDIGNISFNSELSNNCALATK